MSATGPLLLAAAAAVGFGHAVLPDHWVPLAVVGRTRRYPPTKIARLSGLAGVAHVLVSLVVGAVIIAVGLQFRSTVERTQDAIVGGILIATAIGFVASELVGVGVGANHEHHHHHDHDRHDHRHERHHDHSPGPVTRLGAIVIPFGAAASPDLTILPVFLAAAAAGVATAVGTLLIFAAITIGTIVALTLMAARFGYQIHGEWLERWANVVTGSVLAVIGVLILLGII